MKIFNTYDFVSERMKFKPVTNTELKQVRKQIEEDRKNPFGLTVDDLTGDLKDIPMGVVVRMLEETELQKNKADVKIFQKELISSYLNGGFNWNKTEKGDMFWRLVLNGKNFSLFFDNYPEYKKYNLD